MIKFSHLKIIVLLFVASSLSGCLPLDPYVLPAGLNASNGAVVTAGTIYRPTDDKPAPLLPEIDVDMYTVDGKNLGGRYSGVTNVLLTPGVHTIYFEAFYDGDAGPGASKGGIDLTANFEAGKVYTFRTTRPYAGFLNTVQSDAWVQDAAGRIVTPVVPFVLNAPCDGPFSNPSYPDPNC